LKHETFPKEFFRHLDRLVVDGHGSTAADLHFQSSGCDDDIGWKKCTIRSLNTSLGNSLDSIRNNLSLSAVERLEEVASRTDAKALFPGVVLWLEVRIYKISGFNSACVPFVNRPRPALGNARQNL